MPVYKYRCQECDHVFEKLFLSFKDAEKEEVKCPECDGLVKRLFDRSSFATPTIQMDRDILDDPEEYREMHYYEKKKDWKRAAKAADGVSDFAKKKFLQKAQQEE